MVADQFFAKYANQYIDFDGQFGFQCMDLFEQYNKEVVLAPIVWGNAVDVWTRFPQAFYDKIENTPNNCPVKGDVVIWGTQIGPYGHIGICSEADPMKFTSFDQNWPIGSLCHFQNHTYVGVLGWLRPKVTPAPDIPQPVPTPAPQPVPVPVPEPPQTPPSPPQPTPEPIPTPSTPPVNPPPVSVVQPWYTKLWRWLKGLFAPK